MRPPRPRVRSIWATPLLGILGGLGLGLGVSGCAIAPERTESLALGPRGQFTAGSRPEVLLTQEPPTPQALPPAGAITVARASARDLPTWRGDAHFSQSSKQDLATVPATDPTPAPAQHVSVHAPHPQSPPQPRPLAKIAAYKSRPGEDWVEKGWNALEEGRCHESLHPRLALECYRNALFAASTALVSKDLQTATRARVLHDDAVKQVLRISSRLSRRSGRHWTQEVEEAGIGVQGTTAESLPKHLEQLFVAEDCDTQSMNHRYRVGGIGVPVVTLRERNERSRNVQEKLYPRRLYRAATAVAHLEHCETNHPRPVILLHDPTVVSNVSCGGRSWPLAHDLTAPVALTSDAAPSKYLARLGVLRPEKLQDLAGLYMLDPYQPGKIPVVLIHGLNSSSYTWLNIYNDLHADPAIRERYQFWFAYYPTGQHVLFSSKQVREAMRRTRRDLDPMGTDPALNQLVLVGHSMGGLVSRTMIQDSGDRMWNYVFTKPYNQVQMDAESRQLLTNGLFYQPEPYIHRVVFVAAPHRGSKIANQLPGRLASSLIQPLRVQKDERSDIIARNGKDVFQPSFRDRPINSVDNLEWNNPFLQTYVSLPMAPGVPYHSIIARKDPSQPLAQSTDGVVPYASSHMHGAVSEKIIENDDHGCLENPQTSRELRRILVLNLEEAARR